MKDAIIRKARESAEVKEAFFRAEADRIEALARAMAGAFERGGRLYVMGNSGGATDAQSRLSRPMTIGAVSVPSATISLKRTPALSRSP